MSTISAQLDAQRDAKIATLLGTADPMAVRITARIAELEAEQTTYVAQANATVQAYNAAIAELKRLIAPAEQLQTEYIEQTQELT